MDTSALVLGAIADGPRSTREISGDLYRAALDAWLEASEYDFEWGSDAEPLGARLLACGAARDRGVPLQTWEVYPVLRKMERRGLVQRIQIVGHRPMLWRLS